MNLEDILKVIGSILAFFAYIFVIAFFSGLLVMWLWNWLMPAIFGLTTITYWQAWGITALSSILFKSNSKSTTKTDA